MKILFCLIVLFLNVCCSPRVFNKKRHDKAVQWLSSMNPKYQIKRLSRSELKKHLPIIYTYDTALSLSDTRFHKRDTVFSRADKNTFIFKNIQTGKIFLYHFFDNYVATTIEFDKFWNIVEYHGIVGEVY